MKQVIERNYNSIVKRGLITPKTNHVDFYHKANEELKEVQTEFIRPEIDLEKLGFEIADVILVMLNWAKHYNLNIEKYIKEKIVINEKRK